MQLLVSLAMWQLAAVLARRRGAAPPASSTCAGALPPLPATAVSAAPSAAAADRQACTDGGETAGAGAKDADVDAEADADQPHIGDAMARFLRLLPPGTYSKLKGPCS